MSRKVSEFDYGDFRFIVRQAMGTDGMDAFFLLAKGALPAFVELVRDAKGLTDMLAPEFRKQATAALGALGVDDAPTGEATGGVLGLDVSVLTPLIRGAQKVLESLPREERVQLRELLLFNGGVTAIHPDMRPGTEGGKVTGTLTKPLWDELFAGDPLGAWVVFLRVVWLNVGKSSPALAAFRKRAGTGAKAPSSTT